MADTATRQVIAVVTDSFAPFHQEVVAGLRPHFTAAGFGTLVVAGRDVRADRLIQAAEYSDAFSGSLGTHLDVRGAVVVAGATPPQMSNEAIAAYTERLTDGPVVSLGIRLVGVPSITIAWDGAIVQLMDHIVTDPSRRRFVFIRGFAGDPHSQLREAGFRAGLKRAGLEVHEELIVSGSYTVADALSAVSELLDAGHEFDAIVAANDDMATGAIAALSAAQLRVPKDVLVAGFDDSLASFTCEPPLTSVVLDTAHLTSATAEVLVNAITSNVALHPDLEVEIPSGLVIRASTNLEPTQLPQIDNSDFDIVSYLIEEVSGRWDEGRAPSYLPPQPLAVAVAQTMVSGDETFRRFCNSALSKVPAITNRAELLWVRHAVRELRAVITALPHGVIPQVGLSAILKQLVEVDEWRIPLERQLETERLAHRHRQERLVMLLASCSDPESLWDALRRGLGSLGMKNAWVVVSDYAEPDESLADELAMRLVFSLGDEILPTAERFARESVLPDRFRHELEQDVHVLVPLRVGDSDIGYMVIEPRGEYLLELEAIASGVAQVLRHVDQVNDLEHQASRLRVANEALDHLARRDSLTGLANRKMFLDVLENEMDSVDEDSEVAVLFFDLDGFKVINDTLGHEAGDHLLRIVANRAGDVISENDTLARLGGDEFIMILRNDRGSTRPAEVAEAVLAKVSETCIISGEKVSISASMGMSVFPGDGVSTDELIRNADAAMYDAKASGKNRFARYSDGITGQQGTEVELREALRIGIENDEFYLEFQPRVCLATGEVQAFEAFLRWNPSVEVAEEDRKPDRFIVVAERNGLIAALDSVSLDRACKEAKRWSDAGHPVPVSVNMSVKRLQEADIAAQVADALERHDLQPELLELELSEQALVSDLEASRSKLQSVRDMGVRCSIDDYGTGSSSVTDLTHLPLDFVKIDGSIVAGADTESPLLETNRRNIEAIVGLSSVLGLTAVAEGIETTEQYEFLCQIGCEQGQGYEINRSLAAVPEGAEDVWPEIICPVTDPDPSDGFGESRHGLSCAN